MKKDLNKEEKCKHEWIYSDTVKFDKESDRYIVISHYRIIHHCKHCGQLDIQTIYR